VLFAAREAIQGFLGFSPFELIFGWTVCGPSKLVQEAWFGAENNVTLLGNVSSLQDKPATPTKLAKRNLKSVQRKMKQWYDKHAKEWSFKPGEKVLLLLHIPDSTLQAHYFSLYCVEEKLSDVNYIIRAPNFHQQ